MNKENIYYYARVSSEEQGKKGVSIEAQKDRAKTLQIKTENIYIDIAKSGGIKPEKTIIKKAGNQHIIYYDLSERPEFNKLLNILTYNKETKFLYFTKADRLSRDVAYQDILFQTFERYNIEWESLDEPYINNPLTRRILSTISHQELDSTKQRNESVKEYQFEQGINPNRCPYGYRKVNGQIIIEQTEVDIIRQIFNLKQTGKDIVTISKTLRLPYEKVKRTLSQEEFYKGNITYKGQIKKGTHEKII